jgi:septal ring factor EnvC (AmiA/AmiB activator)
MVRRALSIGLLGVLGLLAAAPGARPAPEDSVAASKRSELEDLQRQAREKREAASRLKGQENQTLGQLRRTERDLGVTRKRLRDLRHRRQRLDLQLDATRMDLTRNLSLLADQRVKLSRRLRAMYKYGPARELEFLLSTQSFAQLLARWDYMVMVAEQDRVLLEDVRERKDVVETLERRLEGHLTEVERTTRQTSSQNQRLAAQRQAKQKTLHAIQTQREAYEAAAAQLERDALALKRLIARLEQRRNAAPVPYTGDFARGQGQLDWPVRGEVVGHFGLEKHARFNVVTPNNGIDISAPIGTAVRAVAKGRVDYTSEDYASYGPIIILNHGDSYYTLYAHLSQISVSVGQEVTAGQVIGRSGDTGSLKGAVLHFEVRRGGTALNPEDWLQ